MERSECCNLPPTRGTASGTSAHRLTAAWREAAERGGPACVLVSRDGVLVLGWVNRGLSRLIGRDAADLAGRALRELSDADVDADLDARLATRLASRPAALPGSLTPSRTTRPAGLADVPDGTPLADWARLAHQLARTGGGSAMGGLRTIDGAEERVHVIVTPIDIPPRPADPDPAQQPPGPADADAVPLGHRTLVPAQGRHRMPPSAPADGTTGANGEDAAARGATVVPQGVIGELTPPEPPVSWLVEVEPVSDALADAEAALTLAENRFTALASCAPVGIFVSDAGLRLGYVNERFVSLTGAPTHALLGNAWLDIVHRDDLSAIYTAVQTVLSGTPVELAVRLAEDRGIPRWLQLRLAPTTTPARAAGFIGTAEDVTERRSWEEHLTYQAQHDPLTGLVNRRRLIEVLGDLLTSRRGRDREFAVLFLDLDGFKEINDTYGHDAGDRTLVEVARRLQRVARETDILARVAGDEFVVILRYIQNEVEAEAAARRHLASLDDPIRIGTTQLSLSASVGVAMPSGFDTPESLLRAADRVMYEAKAAGHGLYRLAPPATEEGER